DGRLTADVTYFRNHIKNLIQGAGPTATNISGTSKTQGIELAVAAEPYPQLRLDGSYTYLDAQDADGNELIRRARHIASANATYSFNLEARPARVNLGIRYNGS